MLIEISKLRVSLGGVPILHDVELSLYAGEIYGLLGPNGAGKSTTIAVALGLLKRDAGDVWVLGDDPSVAAHRSHNGIGVVPEQNGFYDWMSAEEYLSFFAALHGRHPGLKEMRERVLAVGLKPQLPQAIGTYSRGMRQRLSLARALIADPKLLILDEPTNGLDPRGRREIHNILLGLADRGVGILLCTHLLDDVDRLCRRVSIIVEGRTVAEGSIADLVGDRDRRLRFRVRVAGEPATATDGSEHLSIVARDGEWWTVDLDPAATPEAAWRDLIFRGWQITEIRREGDSLENLYLAFTERRAA
jgi:ABC-2 type transport system ATP-binding protein